jgi:serine phosphatase RsbU (regulator of sigma subunit)
MKPRWISIGTKLRLALAGTAALSVLAFVVAYLPLLFESVRADRVKIFVEQATRALAETVSHHLKMYQQRIVRLAADLALERVTTGAEIRELDRAAAEPVQGVLPHGIFDLLLVVRHDGVILYANTKDRFGRHLNTTSLWGRLISEFPEEERAFLAAQQGFGKQDWYRSRMSDLVLPRRGESDVARGYAIAYAVPIPQSDRVLLGVINWEAVQAILDRIEPTLHSAGFASAYAFMFARDADSIIAHKFRDPRRLNNYSTRLVADHRLDALAAAIRRGEPSFRYEYPRGTTKIAGLYPVEDAQFGWIVGLGINDSDVVKPVYALLLRLGIVGVGVVLLALVASRYLSRRMTTDLIELRESALRIAEGRFGERVAERSRDEIGEVAKAFNQMTRALVERDELILEQQARLLERSRLEHELSIASEVQQRLLPQVRPPLVTLDYAGFCHPARGVSGDYYDFLPLAPGRLGLILADVAGKGLSAALLMATLHAAVRSHAALLGERCGEMLSTVNALLYESTDAARYATIFYAVYDDSSRALTYVNCGHFPPLLVRSLARPVAVAVGAHSGGAAVADAEKPAWRALETGTIPIGLFQNIPAVQERVVLEPGEWLVAYSDGVSEAQDMRGEEFGRERLVEVVQECEPEVKSAAEMLDRILTAVRRHSGERPQEDDLTLIVARAR